MWQNVILAGCVWILLAPACLAATVTVSGQGGSERSALHQAMRQAIEQQVGVMVDSQRVLHVEEAAAAGVVPITHFSVAGRIVGFRRLA